MPAVTSAQVLGQLPLRLGALAALIRERSEADDPAFLRMREEGHLQFYLDEIAFLGKESGAWLGDGGE